MSRRLPSRLYAIADCGDGGDLLELTRSLLAGGARVVQLRWKDAPSGALVALAGECRRLARAQGALLFINDRVDVALACRADGVHLGQSDLPVRVARRLLGADSWIGVSTHDPNQAREAELAGADYVGFGPLFRTSTKDTGYGPRGLSGLSEVRRAVHLPIVAIGGIDRRNASSAIAAGADAVAMISALRVSSDVAATVKSLRTFLDSA